MERWTGTSRRRLTSLNSLTSEDIWKMSDVALRFAAEPNKLAGTLNGARVGLLFTAPSTRTRFSFWSAALTLGCDVLACGPHDLQVSTGETWTDTGTVLSGILDVAVVRTNGPQRELEELALGIPAVINALTYEEHPTQAIADLCTVREHFGDIGRLRVAYLGQINNTARALALLVSRVERMELDVYSPHGYGFDEAELEAFCATAGRAAVRQYDAIPDEPAPVDVVYTTRWQSMGVEPDRPDWRSALSSFAVTESLMARFSGAGEAMFMHDLPAVRDEEVQSEVLDGRRSLVRPQAGHKTSAAAAALLWALGQI